MSCRALPALCLALAACVPGDRPVTVPPDTLYFDSRGPQGCARGRLSETMLALSADRRTLDFYEARCTAAAPLANRRDNPGVAFTCEGEGTVWPRRLGVDLTQAPAILVLSETNGSHSPRRYSACAAPPR